MDGSSGVEWHHPLWYDTSSRFESYSFRWASWGTFSGFQLFSCTYKLCFPLTHSFLNSYISVALKAFNGTLARTLFAQCIVTMIRTCPTRTLEICASRQIRGLSCLRPKDGQVDQETIFTKLKRSMRGWRSSLATTAKSNLSVAFRSFDQRNSFQTASCNRGMPSL